MKNRILGRFDGFFMKTKEFGKVVRDFYTVTCPSTRLLFPTQLNVLLRALKVARIAGIFRLSSLSDIIKIE